MAVAITRMTTAGSAGSVELVPACGHGLDTTGATIVGTSGGVRRGRKDGTLALARVAIELGVGRSVSIGVIVLGCGRTVKLRSGQVSQSARRS